MDREAWRAAVHGVAELDLSDSKFSKAGFNNMRTVNFQMFKLDLAKAEEPEIKLLDHRKRKSILEKLQLLDYPKAFDCVDHNKLENF